MRNLMKDPFLAQGSSAKKNGVSFLCMPHTNLASEPCSILIKPDSIELVNVFLKPSLHESF